MKIDGRSEGGEGVIGFFRLLQLFSSHLTPVEDVQPLLGSIKVTVYKTRRINTVASLRPPSSSSRSRVCTALYNTCTWKATTIAVRLLVGTQGEPAEKEGRCGRIEPVVQPAVTDGDNIISFGEVRTAASNTKNDGGEREISQQQQQQGPEDIFIFRPSSQIKERRKEREKSRTTEFIRNKK